jgi:hypothetical protein
MLKHATISHVSDLTTTITTSRSYLENNDASMDSVRSHSILPLEKRWNRDLLATQPNIMGANRSVRLLSSDRTIVLTDEENLFCETIGRTRQAQNEKNKTTDMRFSRGSGVDIHIQGVKGEFALAKLLGEDILKHTKKELSQPACRNTRNDHKKDIQWQGKTVDVKCAKERAPFGLMVGAWKKVNPADVYALMVLGKDQRTLTFAGCAFAVDVFVERNSRHLYRKKWYTVPLHELCKHFDNLGKPRAPQYFFDHDMMAKS